MHILLTNDDGIHAEGIQAAFRSLSKIAKVSVVAPDRQQSAVGHAITISDPLRVSKVEKNDGFAGWEVNGTPADCVKIAVSAILKEKPDLVISGINLGPNLGISTLYSGTVSAATEGTILGIPSFAVSLTTFENANFAAAASFSQELAQLVSKVGLPERTLLSVNVPAVSEEEIQGVSITKQGKSYFKEYYEKRSDPWGKIYYWLNGAERILEKDSSTDHHAIEEKKISITPLKCDLTDHQILPQLKAWENLLNNREREA